MPFFKTPWAISLPRRFLSTRIIGFRHFSVHWVFKGQAQLPGMSAIGRIQPFELLARAFK